MSREPKPFKFVSLFLLVVAIFQFLLQTSLLMRGEEYVATMLTIDDTYYYLQPAWNAKWLGYVTFDGIHKTNGVQMLWFGVVLFLARFVRTKTALLYATMMTCFLLNSLCYFVIDRIGRILNRPVSALVLASLWSVQSFSLVTYSMGMENSLHALVFWCTIWQVTVFLVQLRNCQTPNLWRLTIPLILNAWTRLDSGLCSAIIYAYCIAAWVYHSRSCSCSHPPQSIGGFFRKNARALIGSGLLACLGLVVQLGVFRVMGDSCTPISGMIKSGAHSEWGTGFEKQFARALALSLSQVFPESFSLVTVGLVGVLGLIKFRREIVELKAFRSLWYCLAVSWLSYVTIVKYFIIFVEDGVLGDRDNPWYPWYFTPWHIFGIITFALMVDMIMFLMKDRRARVGRGSSLFVEGPRWIVVTLSLLVIGMSGWYFFTRAALPLNKAGPYNLRYQAALWMSSNLPADSICASWNAGQLGFFSDRTVINLDGLVNDLDYYNQVLRGSKSVTDYLYENGVEYVVDYEYGNRIYHRFIHFPDEPPLDWRAIHSFPNTVDGWLQVWKLPSPDDVSQ
jgi:hypothetical protein